MRLVSFVIIFLFPLVCLGQEPSPEVGKHVAGNMDVISMIMSLLLVLILIVACAYILKRFQPSGQTVSGMKVISTLHIGTKERLIVVQVEEEQILLGVTAQQITVLKTLDKPLEVGQPIGADLSKSIIKLIKKSS